MIKAFYRSYWKEILFSLFLSVFVGITCKPFYRTLSDETQLLSTSYAMAKNSNISISTAGKWDADSFYALNKYLPKRPGFFPFLVSIVHQIRGYNYQNAFLLNLFLLFVFFCILSFVGRKFVSSAVGAGLSIYSLSLALIPLYATSGGFDFLTFVFFLLIIIAYYQYYKLWNAEALSLVFALSCCYSLIRYESAAVAFFLLMVALLLRRPQKSFFSKYWLTYLTGILIVSYQVIYSLVVKQVDQNAENGKNFSIQYGISHLSEFFFSHFKWDIPQVTPHVLNLAGMCVAMFFLLKREFKKIKAPLKNSMLLFALGVVLLTIIYSSFHLGIYSYPQTTRLYLLPSFALMMCLPAFVIWHLRKIKNFERVFLVVCIVVGGTYYHKTTLNDRFITEMSPNKETKEIYNFIKNQNQNTLYVYERPGHLTAAKYSAVDYGIYASIIEKVDEMFPGSQIVFIQHVINRTGEVVEQRKLESLHPSAQLRVIAEAPVSYYKLRYVALSNK